MMETSNETSLSIKKELNELQTTLSTVTPFENVTNFSSKVISAAEKIVGLWEYLCHRKEAEAVCCPS